MNKFEIMRRIYNNIPPDPEPEIEEIEEIEPVLGRLGMPIDRVYGCRICDGDLEGDTCDDCFLRIKREREEEEKRKSSLVNAGIGAAIGISLFNSAFNKNY